MHNFFRTVRYLTFEIANNSVYALLGNSYFLIYLSLLYCLVFFFIDDNTA